MRALTVAIRMAVWKDSFSLTKGAKVLRQPLILNSMPVTSCGFFLNFLRWFEELIASFPPDRLGIRYFDSLSPIERMYSWRSFENLSVIPSACGMMEMPLPPYGPAPFGFLTLPRSSKSSHPSSVQVYSSPYFSRHSAIGTENFFSISVR